MNVLYKIVTPENFTTDHLDFINEFKKSIHTISTQSDIMIGAKDVNSRHIISTDAYAQKVGLKSGNDVSSRFDKEMPCDGTAQYADCYVKEDLSLINTLNPDKSLSTLNIHHYSDGLKSRLFKKHLLYHHTSRSILGTVYSGFDIELKNVLNIIPSYIIKFGAIGSLSITNQKLINSIELTDYEQEVCFLLLLNWEFSQIASFMNKTRPEHKNRTSDTIIKKKNYICKKLNLPTTNVSVLQDFLVSTGFHNNMPVSFYNTIVGSTIL